MTHGTDNLLLVSEEGKAIQFNEDEVRVMGRAAAGVRGMKIKDSDNLVAADIVTPEHAYVFSVSELGYGKISPVDEYREQGRGGMGIKIGATSGKTGNIIFAALLTEEERTKGEVILISRGGQTIRLALSTVRKTSRVTQGVILAKIKAKDDALVSATIIVEGESELEEVPDTENLADSTAQ
ncbi:MAG TPA: DNA gyrase C-terminal beta-propeller domain-containing protein [bacterium]|nr:DNA gyrase C-terminal beta-propeller domain-containing protein [bacterium]